MAEHEVDWDVVFDARGHFTEPHDGEVVNGAIGPRKRQLPIVTPSSPRRT